jgi:hypothetical protein
MNFGVHSDVYLEFYTLFAVILAWPSNCDMTAESQNNGTKKKMQPLLCSSMVNMFLWQRVTHDDRGTMVAMFSMQSLLRLCSENQWSQQSEVKSAVSRQS